MTAAIPTSDIPRLRLTDAAPVRARLTNALDRTFAFDLRLTEVSADELAGLVAPETARRLGVTGTGPVARRAPGRSLFWGEFRLPGDAEPFEYVVCLSAGAPRQTSAGTLMRWTLCGGDDSARYRRNAARIARLVAAADQAARQVPAGCSAAGGE